MTSDTPTNTTSAAVPLDASCLPLVEQSSCPESEKHRDMGRIVPSSDIPQLAITSMRNFKSCVFIEHVLVLMRVTKPFLRPVLLVAYDEFRLDFMSQCRPMTSNGRPPTNLYMLV